MGAALATTVAVVSVLAAALLVPVDIRHSAPFGFRLTLDLDRAIAVTGVTVTPNYPNFHRVDLDLRAYTPDERYDVTVYVQEVPLPVADDEGEAAGADEVTEPEPPAEEGPLRTVHLGLDQAEIAAEKGAFADPFITVRFDPIADSAGKAYYVWVDTGASNDDAVLTVWSVKSYSQVAGYTALAAFLAAPPGDLSIGAGRVLFGVAMAVFGVATVALAVALAGARERDPALVHPRPGDREMRARTGPGRQ